MAQLGYFAATEGRHHDFALTTRVKVVTGAQSIRRANSDPDARNGDVSDSSAYRRYSASRSPRSCVPWRHQNCPEVLQQSIIKSWQGVEPSDARKREIAEVVKQLTHTINYSMSPSVNPTKDRFRVDVFGSMAWGGEAGKGGDLDLVIIDDYLARGYEPSLWRVSPTAQRARNPQQRRQTPPNGKVPQIYDVQWLARFMQNSAGVLHPQAISATTPIVKFHLRDSDLECDINVNDMGGWFNSRLILAYCEISPYVLRPLIHALKKWLAHHNLNDPSGMSGQRSMSSYCLTLMAIAYLQHIEALPNLQASVPDSSAKPSDLNQKDVIWVSWGRDQGQVAHIGFEYTPPLSWQSSCPNLNVAEALRGFFQYFNPVGGSAHFSYQANFVSVLNGGMIQRRYKFRSEETSRRNYRRSLEGLPRDVILSEMRAYDEEHNKDAVVGKGDRYQLRQWGNCKLVVQDPLLWDKNCAGAMDRPAVEKFIQAVTKTDSYLRANEDATLGDLLRLNI